MSRTRRGQQAGNRIDPRTARGGHLLNIYLAIYLSLLFKRHSGSIDGLDDCMAAELDNPLQNLTLPSALVFEAHLMLAFANSNGGSQYEAGVARLNNLQERLAEGMLETSAELREVQLRAQTGLTLCRALLNSQSSPAGAMRDLMEVRFVNSLQSGILWWGGGGVVSPTDNEPSAKLS